MNRSILYLLAVLLFVPFALAGGNNGISTGRCSNEEANYFYDSPGGPLGVGGVEDGFLYSWDGTAWILEWASGYNYDTKKTIGQTINVTASGNESSFSYTSTQPLNAVFSYESLGLAQEKVFTQTGYGHDTIDAREGSLYSVLLCVSYKPDGEASGGVNPPSKPTQEVPEFGVIGLVAVSLAGAALVISKRV